ncbi:hypothetical protein MMC28_007939 [Mycoblastus sanguinarius]|nr:hypothetical protein [Mycoblastus sanguinarius]
MALRILYPSRFGTKARESILIAFDSFYAKPLVVPVILTVLTPCIVPSGSSTFSTRPRSGYGNILLGLDGKRNASKFLATKASSKLGQTCLVVSIHFASSSPTSRRYFNLNLAWLDDLPATIIEITVFIWILAFVQDATVVIANFANAIATAFNPPVAKAPL